MPEALLGLELLPGLQQLTGLGNGNRLVVQVDGEAIAAHLEAIHASPEGQVAAEAAGCQVPDRALRLQHGLPAGVNNLNRCLQGQPLLAQVATQGAGPQGLA
jgi:hypothetical protein